MGFFSRFTSKNKNEQDSTNEWHSTAANDASLQATSPVKKQYSLTEHVEQCFHYNSKCIGAAMVTSIAKSRKGNMPGFCSYLNEMVQILAPSLSRIMTTRSGYGASWMVPNDFTSICQRQPSLEFSQYVADMGEYSLRQATGGSSQSDHSIQAAVTKRTAEMAIAECLSLLKAAEEENARDLVSIMLDDPSYLLALSIYYLILQANLIQIEHPNAVIFIPDSSLDPNSESSKTLLRSFNYDVNDPSPIVPVPPILTFMWMENSDGNIATGHHKMGGTDGIPGVFLRVGTQEMSRYLEKVADNFVKGVRY